MKIAALKEQAKGEYRVAVTPETTKLAQEAVVRSWNQLDDQRFFENDLRRYYKAQIYRLACQTIDRSLPNLKVSQIPSSDWFEKELGKYQHASGSFPSKDNPVKAAGVALAILALSP